MSRCSPQLHLIAEAMWIKLGDIPIDSDECIEEPFCQFPIGTFREDIWHWFEERFDLSVVEDLMRMKP